MAKRDGKDSRAVEVLAKLEDYRSHASRRLETYRTNRRWFESEKEIMWESGRRDWESEVMANMIEANVRTIAAVLTDSKPIFRVIGMPMQRLDDQRLQEMRLINENMDNALNHVWRVNNMHAQLKRMVLDASLTGTLSARVYWDSTKYGGYGEIGIEAVHPQYIFFDETITNLDIEDGSCDYFIYAIRKPLSWFHYYFPGKKVRPTDDTKDDPEVTQMGEYVECYKAEYEVKSKKSLHDGKIDMVSEAVYPRGRKIVLGTDTVLVDEPIDIFPFAVEPFQNATETYFGENDVTRQIELQRDLNVSMARLSQHIALSASRQFIGSKEGGLDPEVFAENADRPGMLFLTEGGKTVEDVTKNLSTIPTPEIESELFQYPFFLMEMMEKVTGVTKLIQGMAQKRERQTGFEIGKMLETATIRLRERAGHIEEFLRQMGLRVLEYVKQYYTEGRDLWSVDERTQELVANTFEYPQEKDKITGEAKPVEYEFDIVVQPDSTLPMDLNSKADLAMRLKERQVISNAALLRHVNWPNMEDALPDPAQSPQGQAAPPPPPTG